MITVALRYFDKFAPEGGAVTAHQKIINEQGFVYYGKLGAPLSMKTIDQMMENDEKRFLLIHSGKQNRYWVHYESVTRDKVDERYIPEYYRDRAADFKTWFKVVKIDPAPNDVMKHCFVNFERANGEKVTVRGAIVKGTKFEYREKNVTYTYREVNGKWHETVLSDDSFLCFLVHDVSF